ncbi:hypothetical protein [Thermoflexus hugenholtzii]
MARVDGAIPRAFPAGAEGKVFVVFSITDKGGRKRIWNEEVVEAIREELGRLRAEAGEGPDQGA